jgi:L-threonylcarbamoyladenylate synthase
MSAFSLEEIHRLAQVLHSGGTLLYPTETVWGLGCDVQNTAAIDRIFEIKQRPREKQFVLLVDSIGSLEQYVEQIPQKAIRLIEYYEKPLTIVYSNARNLPPILIGQEATVAIRVTRDPFCQALCQHFGGAIVSTSANLSGEPYPTCFADIPQQIKDSVTAIAQHRQDDTTYAPPSTIVKVVDGEDLIFIRK